MDLKELIEKLDQRYGNPYAAKECGLIQEAIEVLRLQSDEIIACYQHIQDLQEK
jgi:hypothetical protein